ncbi:FUSC family membrane protein [Nonlabens dokdonensis]|uniref:FUSC family protein n=1 Tax=Nonlabens dokdonensis TaxID=328515 RepID=UPI0026EBE662|nr:FUSC family membrane protein [Nonlabens dokdonensis]
MKQLFKQLELFLKSSDFDRGVRLGISIVIPFGVLYVLGFIEYAPAFAVGSFLSAPGDIPGSVKRKVNAILISIGLTMLITLIILFSKPILPLLLVVLALISFFVSIISVYGFRASLVSLSGLLAMVIAFAVNKDTPEAIFIHLVLMGLGGLWYIFVSYVFRKLAPQKDQNQLLSDVLMLIGKYLRLRAKLLTKKSTRDKRFEQILQLQNQINEKQETLREILFTGRKRSGRSRYEEKQLLIFLSSIQIFELIEATRLDYKTLDKVFGERKQYLKAAKKLNKTMSKRLILLSELLIQKDKIPSDNSLTKALKKAEDTITDYINAIQLPEAREGALLLKNLYDYQEQLVQEIKAIRQAMENVKEASKLSLRRQDSSKFLTLQEYRLNVLTQNFSFKSKVFRHSLRFAIAILFAYCIGYFFEIQNTYWILLTIVVIMRPSYGLTKDRSKDRVIGTLIGAAVAIGIVLVTQNEIVYGILAVVGLVLAFSLLQRNYKSAAAFVTISIIFVYSFINPDAFEVIQYRVLDTIIGSIIAVIANYIILPTWEADNLKDILLKALETNKNYLLATQKFYADSENEKLSYNVARKEAFLAIANLNAAFQRLTQDPKSKQKKFQVIYKIVTLNHTMISAVASIGNFIKNHKTTPASKEFNNLVHSISQTLEDSYTSIAGTNSSNKSSNDQDDPSPEKLLHKYQELSDTRDKNLQDGNTELDQETLHHLQEAFLIANHMKWLQSLSKSLYKATQSYKKALVEES